MYFILKNRAAMAIHVSAAKRRAEETDANLECKL